MHVDAEIDARGYDKIRSRIEVLTKDGRTLVEWADERYRGGPSNPISDADLEASSGCARKARSKGQAQDRLVAAIHGVERLDNAATLTDLMKFTAASH